MYVKKINLYGTSHTPTLPGQLHTETLIVYTWYFQWLKNVIIKLH